MGDMKHYLRKMDFPAVVPEALHHIQKLWLPDCTSQQLVLMGELASEFVFFEVDKWGNLRRQQLKPLKELQIIERISLHFSLPGNDQKAATFLFLFPVGSQNLESRLPFLAKLISMAIAILNGNLLNHVGLWMQLYGCISEASIYVTKIILETHFKDLSLCKISKNLPQVSPLFCASLITAITHIYLTSCPPTNICKIILNWITSDPTNCYSPFKMVVPRSFNFIQPQTPLPGLLVWVILSPLHAEVDEMSLGKDSNNAKDPNLFSELHLATLQCMRRAPSTIDLTCSEVLPTDSLIIIVESLKKFTASSKECMKIALDRLAQILEVALSTGCIFPPRGKLGVLFIHCCDLQYNRFLKIVLKRWSQVLKSSQSS